MSKKPPTEPLRGDAAWRAQRAEIAKRNEAAHARALREREARSEQLAAQRARDDRREQAMYPEQPHP